MQKEWLSVKETAKAIGKHENTIYTMIEDGRIKALKTSEGKYKVPVQSIFLFQEEKEIKENEKELENSVKQISKAIDEQVIISANSLYIKIISHICEIQNSNEYKEKKKILGEKIIVTDEDEIEKKLKVINRLKQLDKSLFIKQRDMISSLQIELENHFKMCDLKYDIYDFEDTVKLDNEERLEMIEYQREKEYSNVR